MGDGSPKQCGELRCADDGWLPDAEWDSGYDDWSPGDRVILTTDEGEGYMFNENNRTQVDVFPYNPSEIDF